MLGLGPFEVVVILVVVLIVFGAGKLPQVGEALGRGIRNFKKATDGQDEPRAVDVTPAPKTISSHSQEAPLP